MHCIDSSIVRRHLVTLWSLSEVVARVDSVAWKLHTDKLIWKVRIERIRGRAG